MDGGAVTGSWWVGGLPARAFTPPSLCTRLKPFELAICLVAATYGWYQQADDGDMVRTLLSPRMIYLRTPPARRFLLARSQSFPSGGRVRRRAARVWGRRRLQVGGEEGRKGVSPKKKANPQSCSLCYHLSARPRSRFAVTHPSGLDLAKLDAGTHRYLHSKDLGTQ